MSINYAYVDVLCIIVNTQNIFLTLTSQGKVAHVKFSLFCVDLISTDEVEHSPELYYKINTIFLEVEDGVLYEQGIITYENNNVVT